MRRARVFVVAAAVSLALAAIAAAQSELQTETLARVLPVVGSTHGNNGSFFRTGLQLRNAGGSALAGRFVYHPAGIAGSSSDPSLPFAVGAGQTLSFEDIVDSMGIAGLGSLDLMLPPASASPVVVTRVFNDAGASGTSGFAEDAVAPDQRGNDSPVLTAGSLGVLVAPPDLNRFRYNIGVRTLSSGVGTTIRVRSAEGVIVHAFQKNLAPTFFLQQSAADFLGWALQASDSIEITIDRGSVIVYGATTDNETNDPSIQIARVVPPS